MKIHKKITAFTTSLVLAFLAALPLSANADGNYINLNKNPNGIGGLTIADAVCILQYLAGAFEPSILDQLDINDSGIISQVDAQLIIMYDAGGITI